jgi:hypothetical protein
VPEREESLPATPITTSADEPSVKYTILKDIKDFKNRFNVYAKLSESPLRFHRIEVKKGEIINTFQYSLTDHIEVMGVVNKEDQTIQSVMIIAQGDGSLKSGVNIIVSMGGIIAAISPQLSASERGDILRDLGILRKGADINNLSANTVRGEVKYFISSSDMVGIVFGCQHADQ